MGKGTQAELLFHLLNPIYHSDSADKAKLYRVEPYVIAADVYGVPPHTGRGGWTWYTGSSGWMYRLGIEAILTPIAKAQNYVSTRASRRSGRVMNWITAMGKPPMRLKCQKPRWS